MRLNETQKRLDKVKYIESQKRGYDLSGLMFYCICCDSESTYCSYPQEEREKKFLCARAYECYTKKQQRLNKSLRNRIVNKPTTKTRKKKPIYTPPKVYTGDKVTCDCSQYLKHYGNLVEDSTNPKYVCPNCGSVKCVDVAPINWAVNKGAK